MCSEIDERTRENPEGAMVHTQLLNVQLREAQKAREASKPEPQHFDTEAHRAFMRGLG
ncbi:hypothetical protein FSO04_24210 [Paraburkholderia madseniana]|uniref:Uncharacterized protein n=1 Tax=Paraburkholderia madseniana TaxID=2599607 RepID=A0A6N6WBN8_9BURK|nr:hypothetical protein [Paraburkholderia madseniana]KAE8757328.1 hypothetical protein FSO04_24210 [Paraburkholderia madseniana]